VTSRDAKRSAIEMDESLKGMDAAIDFSVAGAVLANVSACARARVPLVEGTTGWNAALPEVRRVVEEHGGAFI
jgi:4-hydroxy-tetrahydrodipicolinate reductase